MFYVWLYKVCMAVHGCRVYFERLLVSHVIIQSRQKKKGNRYVSTRRWSLRLDPLAFGRLLCRRLDDSVIIVVARLAVKFILYCRADVELREPRSGILRRVLVSRRGWGANDLSHSIAERSAFYSVRGLTVCQC